MKYLRATVLAAIFLGAALASSSSEPAPSAAAPWTLVWSDEFNGANGSPPDPAKWVFELGGKGWGNDELETYTNRRVNASIQDGNLVIQALKETYTGPDGVTRHYTSARLKTQGLFQQREGRFEARLKLPYSQGMWPAFWMMGDDVDRVGWPQCGEIDIMENVGREPSLIHGSAHGPGYVGEAVGTTYQLANGRRFADDFHVFAVEWERDALRFYVDTTLYQTITPASLPSGSRWVFDHPFFLLLNLAVGGSWPGSPDATTVFPQKLRVDYVRVYRR